MRYSVRSHPEAEAEVNEAVEYLDLECPGLGDAFLDDLQHAVVIVVSHPEIAPIIEVGVRQELFRRFPYSIMYSVVGTEIRVLAVVHQHRRPFYRRRRT